MKNTDIVLHKATLSDAEEIWEMQKIAFAELLERYQDFETNPAREPLHKVEERIVKEGRTYYFIEMQGQRIGAINVMYTGEGDKKRIAPLFLLPQFQGNGYAQEAIRKVEAIHGTHCWELETILQEEKLCHLYEKMGYRKRDQITEINEKMSLVLYEK